MKKINIRILFGEYEVKQYEESNSIRNLEDNVSDYSFDTEQEKNAFLLGLESAKGWQDFVLIKNH
jgi:hypothetical protein